MWFWVTNEDRNAVKNLMEPAQSNHQEINQDIRFCSDDESVIPICVDPQEIQPVNHLTSEPVILFVGGMHWPPNAEGVRWFNDEILPLIQEKVPGTKFLAVGKNPPEELIWSEGWKRQDMFRT